MHEWEKMCKEEIKDYGGWGKRNKKAQELRREINGADSAKGENTMFKGRKAYGEK